MRNRSYGGENGRNIELGGQRIIVRIEYVALMRYENASDNESVDSNSPSWRIGDKFERQKRILRYHMVRR